MGRIPKAELPLWAQTFDYKGHQLRKRGDGYQLIKITAKYDKVKKRGVKISKYLGTVQEGIGFVPSRVRGAVSLRLTTGKSYGDYWLFENLSKKYLSILKKHFPSHWKELYVISFLRTESNLPFKNISHAYESSYISEVYPGLALSGSSITKLLEELGTDRLRNVNFLREFIQEEDLVIFDGTTYLSSSKTLIVNGVGYDHHGGISNQFGILYGFSLKTNAPVYYRVFEGSMRDLKPFKDAIEELAARGITIVADKGFNDEEFEKYLSEVKNIKYVIAINRNNRHRSDYMKEDFSRTKYNESFNYQKTLVYCYYSNPEPNIYIYHYLNTTLQTDEISVLHSKLLVEDTNYTKEDFEQDKRDAGWLSIKTNIPPSEANGASIYGKYKIRNQIEKYIDIHKNVLGYDVSYMSSDVHLEGWALINHLSMMHTFQVYSLLERACMIGDTGFKDINLNLRKWKKSRYTSIEIPIWMDQSIPAKTSKLIEELKEYMVAE